MPQPLNMQVEPPTGPQGVPLALETQAGFHNFHTRMHEQGDASAIEHAVKAEPSTGPHPAAPKKFEVLAQGSGLTAEVRSRDM